MFENLQWQKDHMRLNNLLFRLEPCVAGWKEGQHYFRLFKEKRMYDQYESIFSGRPGFRANNILEIGIWDGGSLALWTEILHPSKLVGLDFKTKRGDSDYFRKYVEMRGFGDTVKTYWGINQADGPALLDICNKEFSEPLDLIIDDGSHYYEETKKSFQVLFPKLRPGGLYIIEDWAWIHWPEYDNDRYFAGKTGLSQLIFELTEMIGSNRDAPPANLTVMSEFAVVERRALQIPQNAPLMIDERIVRRPTSNWRVNFENRFLRRLDVKSQGLKEFCRGIKRKIQKKNRLLITKKEASSLKVCLPLFDAEWYLKENPDVKDAGMDPWAHFVRFGIDESRNPHPLFDISWYLKQNPDVATSHVNPLEHYLVEGANKGYNPNALFDTSWYRRQYPELATSGLNPLVHYVQDGWRKGFDPSANFDAAVYVKEHPDIPSEMNPLEHFLVYGSSLGSGVPVGLLKDSEAVAMRRQATYFMNPGPGFEAVDNSIMRGAMSETKVIAFYLPQFHQVPENDKWWGTGFTEWRNVTRAQSRFLGHYQPRLPADLGFYDLRTPTVMARQVEMAKNAGIFGFCFYYYFFDGKKLLDAPCASFAADSSINFPFSFLWANESWCRNWDGGDQTVLLRQSHDRSYEKELIDDLAQYFTHPNYIRVQGRPVFTLYRPDILPDASCTIDRWRREFQKRHRLNPYFLMCQTFNVLDPRPLGFDGAIEFPPHKIGRSLPEIRHKMPQLDPDFSGKIFRYSDLVTSSLSQAKSEFDLIRTVLPAWDNEARSPNRGKLWYGSTPQLYEQWLQETINLSGQNPFQGESMVFINAWNEWAEGAYLEPDLHWGGAYLNATARAIAKSAHQNSAVNPAPSTALSLVD